MQKLTDQVFTYRETPAEQNGVGQLTTIKGNSLVFNQQVWKGEQTAKINSIKGNTVSFNQLFDSDTPIVITTSTTQAFKWANIIPNHKYYVFINGSFALSWQVYDSDTRTNVWATGSNNNKLAQGNYKSVIVQPTSYNYLVVRNVANTISVSSNVNWQPMLIDLTLMGIDNLTTTVQVEEWLSTHIGNLPYFGFGYRLISFNGTGLKTTGKNLLSLDLTDIKSFNTGGTWNENVYTANGLTFTINEDYSIKVNGTASARTDLVLLKGAGYDNLSGKVLNGTPSGGSVSSYVMFIAMGTSPYTPYATDAGAGSTINTINKDTLIQFFIRIANGLTVNDMVFKPMIRLASVTDATFEPYTSNTLSLPTLTYFPTGMKSAGSVYDELSDKAYTRVGSVDLGTLTWTKRTASEHERFDATLPGAYKPIVTDVGNIICSKYVSTSYYDLYNHTNDNVIALHSNNEQAVVYDSSALSMDANQFKAYLSGTYLFYELATPTEADISLDLTYPVWNGGTEQILPVNDSTPDTAPIKANITYPDRTEDTEFLYKQTTRQITLINGHSYITKIGGTWSNVAGTGQTLTVGDDDMVIDLTQMANPYITNYSQFTALYPDYYEFNKGELLSFNGDLKVTGKNLFNEDLLLSASGWSKSGEYYSGSNGQLYAIFGNPYNGFWKNNYLLNKRIFITITGYTEASNANTRLRIWYTDGTTEDITVLGTSPATLSATSIADKIVDKITMTYSNASKIYIKDFCIKFLEDENAYEPYKSQTITLPKPLRSAGSVYDESTARKDTVKIGRVDLGTLNWSYGTFHTTNNVFYCGLADAKTVPDWDTRSNVLCEKYLAITFNSIRDSNKGIVMAYDSVIIYDSTYSNENTFKTAMSGVYLLYEKATPTETELSPQTPDDFFISDVEVGGTEEIISDNMTAPIRADMSYSTNAIEVITHPNPQAGGETEGDGWYLVGDEATVNATPNNHYVFENWVLDDEVVSTEEEYTFEVDDV